MLLQKPFEFQSLMTNGGAVPEKQISETTHVEVYHPRIFRNLLNKSGISNSDFNVNIKLQHSLC